MVIRLSNGREIQNPTGLVETFFDQHAHGLYDLLPVKPDDSLDLVSLASLAFFEENNPGLDEWRGLWQNRAKLEIHLQGIPPEIKISDANILWDHLSALFAEFLRQKGFRCPRVSKILHKKRPHLIPILDETRVINCYYSAVVDTAFNTAAKDDRANAAKEGKNFSLSVIKKDGPLKLPEVMLALIKEVRKDVIQNLVMLSKIQAQLAKMGRSLTLVRIFDIILWENAMPAQREEK